jgi:hypothetical protein
MVYGTPQLTEGLSPIVIGYFRTSSVQNRTFFILESELLAFLLLLLLLLLLDDHDEDALSILFTRFRSIGEQNANILIASVGLMADVS